MDIEKVTNADWLDSESLEQILQTLEEVFELDGVVILQTESGINKACHSFDDLVLSDEDVTGPVEDFFAHE